MCLRLGKRHFWQLTRNKISLCTRVVKSFVSVCASRMKATLGRAMSNEINSVSAKPAGKPSMVTYYLRDAHQIRALQSERNAKLSTISRWTDEYNTYHSHLQDLVTLGENEGAEVNLYTVTGCTLVEPRKGPRITERTSTSGGRLFIGTKVGPVLIGKSGASQGHSTSVTNPIQDELTQVDTGQVTVTTRGISFIGQMFTRHAEFAKLTAWKGEEDRITIAASNRQSVWIIDFASEGDMWMAGVLIDAAEKLADRRLDTSKRETAEKLQSVLTSSTQAQETELLRAFSDAYTDLESTNLRLREFHQKYPGKVTDPGPELRFGAPTN